MAFGLFHGVVFFPVLLSLCGPDNDNDRHDVDASHGGEVAPTAGAAAAVGGDGGDDSAGATGTTAASAATIEVSDFMLNLLLPDWRLHDILFPKDICSQDVYIKETKLLILVINIF